MLSLTINFLEDAENLLPGVFFFQFMDKVLQVP